MISKEELFDTLNEMMDGDLSVGAIEYIVSDLLEKYVVFKRPEVRASRDGKFIRLADTRLTDTSLQFWQEHMAEADEELEQNIRDYVTGHTVLALYEKEQDDDKAARREEIARESGHPVYMYAPQTIKTLIARLVEAEFANARDRG